jgi:Tfp pilus assembly protein PilP
MKRRYLGPVLLALLLPLAAGSCKSKPAAPAPVAGTAPAPDRGPAAPGAPVGTQPGTGPGEAEASDLIVHKLTEESFIESPSRRDPFRSFIIPLTKQETFSTTPQIISILDQYQIDELKLVAIVSSSGGAGGSPMAMVEDPAGVGHIIRRGNYVGKGETVRRVSTGEEIQIFWKVARIREDAIVFEREDPFAATEATVTKILPLVGD